MKTVLAFIGSVVAGLVPGYLMYCLWSFLMTLAPNNEWAGVVKLVITLVCLWFGGGLTITATILAFMLAVLLLATIFDL